MLFNKLVRVLRKHLTQITWPSIVSMLAFHAIVSWYLLWLAGEVALTSLDIYPYYYVVTTSTVGYGDFSPTTEAGRLIVSFIQIPLGLAIFGALLGKLGQSTTTLLRKAMTGEKDFSHLDTHILIFGWHESRTAKMIKHILGDNKRVHRKIVLCVTDEMEHPFIDNPHVDFARLKSFTENDELERINVREADRIIVDCDNDDMTFTCALKLSPIVEEGCHISAYFNDETKVEMLNKYTDNVECNSSKIAETLVRSMQDPGISRLQDELMSTLHGDTQFSTEVPDSVKELTFGQLFHYLKNEHDCILLAIAKDRIGNQMFLNPETNFLVHGGHILHYVAKDRLMSDEIAWQQVAKVNV